MSHDREHFESWYASVLELLYPHRHAGIVIATIAFPLLERYLRQRIQLPATESLNSRFHSEVLKVIPDLSDAKQAQLFWSAFRNGLLHQVTLQLETKSGAQLPTCALTHDIDRIFVVSENVYILHPVLFAKRVIEEIRRDFSTFVGQVHIGPPLAKPRPMKVYGAPLQHTATVSTTPYEIIGTSAAPTGRKHGG